ncbi:hypothetical protein TWF192_006827 [Orbilia oligospora]|uniref:Auxin efflux carrier n=1 Tax=Orbilia oligospora TaxID=2813651 RepID=A0A6G1M6W4_ORBOL|nr:hypothetical protein TWF679_006425 [Orbilia oligospora]KAF3213587.1 hypothetical protein TWF191_010060 [Orbilia oligospora]KAF3246672.1 hypothetical protein TWF192_006827 [Orbilia oligospora]
MSFITSPTAFRLRDGMAGLSSNDMAYNSTDFLLQTAASTAATAFKKHMPPHSSHPSLGNLILLVFEAVLEVVCVSLPGYIIARQGMFDAGNQKFIANLNVSLFTPCLIFTKLASQLTVDKLADLAVIPIIFVFMTAVSYVGSVLVAKAFKFRRRARNFVIAMGVFGNSNSLPISLVLSLAFTLKGLHWSKIPGDNDNDVAARGILYLLIFQQLGQLVRWSWGYHVLLAPASAYTVEEGGTREADEEADDEAENPFFDENDRYTDEPAPIASRTESVDSESEWDEDLETGTRRKPTDPFRHPGFPEYEGLATPTGEAPQLIIGRPITGMNRSDSENIRSHPDRLNSGSTIPPKMKTLPPIPQSLDSVAEAFVNTQRKGSDQRYHEVETPGQSSTAVSASASNISSPTTSRSDSPTRSKMVKRDSRVITSFPEPSESAITSPMSSKTNLLKAVPEFRHKMSKNLAQATKKLPKAPKWSKKPAGFLKRFFMGLWEFMNPPLWAMLAALLVASVPALQKLFFTPGTFVENSVTRAVKQSGNVAVPLILVVLGANLAGNTIPKPEDDPLATPGHHKATARHERNILLAALISRMLIPTIIIAPMLAIAAKFLPISLLGDPIFIIVCFLLAGAPSALQLSQICQLNGVYENVMAKILFWSYVVVILPSTLILVICGLEVVEWATYDKA